MSEKDLKAGTDIHEKSQHESEGPRHEGQADTVEDKAFDASRYAFFGDAGQGEELGGLDDEDDNLLELHGKENEASDVNFPVEANEFVGETGDNLADISALTAQFAKLNNRDETHVTPLNNRDDTRVNPSASPNNGPPVALSFDAWKGLSRERKPVFETSQPPSYFPPNQGTDSVLLPPGFQPHLYSQAPSVGPASARIGSHHMTAFTADFPPRNQPLPPQNFSYAQSHPPVNMPLNPNLPEEPPAWGMARSPGADPGPFFPPYQPQPQPQMFPQVQPQFPPPNRAGMFYDQGVYQPHALGPLPAGMRSQYMSSDEVDTVVRIQRAATHTVDPYVDDYYHQAVMAKRVGSSGRPPNRFAPSVIREGRVEPQVHAFLPVEGLGRVPLSNVRRPKPLLEVESSEGDSLSQEQRPLVQEPMLAARIAIEDGNSILLDVDDIDRMLQAGQGNASVQQLLRRRRMLLQALAVSLQIITQAQSQRMGRASPGPYPVLAGSQADVIFMRIVSLPKGRKLLARFLRLLLNGSDLQCSTVMTICRKVRFLFGGLQPDAGALARAVEAAFSGMSLSQLTDCLSQVVVGEEKASSAARAEAAAGQLPPALGLGGGEVSIVVTSLLQHALMALQKTGVNPQHRGQWQVAFDAFFSTLSRSLYMENILRAMPLTPATANAVSREMPLDVLKACVHHTTPDQRRLVLAVLFGLMPNAQNPAQMQHN